ncbi:VOC family protein [Mycolicibacterium brisbanense]
MIRLSLHYAARDLDRARLLFEAALDVEFSEERHLEDIRYWSANLSNGAVLELWPASSGRPPSRVQLELEVTDLDAAAERLNAAGIEVRRLAAAVLMTDPNGNVIALSAR